MPERGEALATLEEGRQRVGDLIATLSDEEIERPATLGGGDWGVKDLMGHIALWERLALEAFTAWRAGRVPEAEARGFRVDGGVDRINAEGVERTRGMALREVREEAEQTHRRLVQAIAETTDEDWSSKAPYPTERRERLGTLLGGILGAPQRAFGHAFAHAPDLEAYVSGR